MNIQDVLWLADAADEIRDIRFQSYFIPIGGEDLENCRQFHTVVLTTQEFRDRFEAAWRRLTKDEWLKVHLYKSHDKLEDTEPAAKW